MSKNANECCGLCNCYFKVKFGNITKYSQSYENIFKPSNRKGVKGTVLSDICQSVSIILPRNPAHSEFVCNPCGRKIRNLGELFKFVNDRFVQVHGTAKTKRPLLTPKNSPEYKARQVNSPA